MEEQRQWLATRLLEAKDRKGKLHFRRGYCRNGCPAYALHVNFGRRVGKTSDTLSRACSACTLDPEPMRDAERVEEMWQLPDSVLRLSERPHHFVAGVAILRLRNRSPF